MSAEIKKKYVRIGQIVVMMSRVRLNIREKTGQIFVTMSVNLGPIWLSYCQIFVTSTIVLGVGSQS